MSEPDTAPMGVEEIAEIAAFADSLDLCAPNPKAGERMAGLLRRLLAAATQGAGLRAALERIERWFGEFPDTGKFWDNADGSMSDRPMSYAACNGSNGERDYMRGIARAALSQPTPAPSPDAGVEAACEPWKFHVGEPPDYDSPLSAVFGAGMAYTEKLLARFLGVKDYEGGDGSEDFDADATMTLQNILTAAGLFNPDEGNFAKLPDAHTLPPVAAEPAPQAEGAEAKPLTAADLADALECFWNAAIGVAHEVQDSTAGAVMSCMVQGVAAVADHLKKPALSAPAADAGTRELEREERAHDQTLKERDAFEDALSQAYYLVVGHSPPWSSAWGISEALEEIDEAQTLLRRAALTRAGGEKGE